MGLPGLPVDGAARPSGVPFTLPAENVDFFRQKDKLLGAIDLRRSIVVVGVLAGPLFVSREDGVFYATRFFFATVIHVRPLFLI